MQSFDVYPDGNGLVMVRAGQSQPEMIAVADRLEELRAKVGN